MGLRLSVTKSILVCGIMMIFCTSPALAVCDGRGFIGQLNQTAEEIQNGLSTVMQVGGMAMGMPGLGGGGTSDQGTHDRLDAVLQSTNGQIKQLAQTFCPLSSINAPGVQNDLQRIQDIYNAFLKQQQQQNQPIVDDGFAASQMLLLNKDSQDLLTLINMVENNQSSTAIMQIQAKLQGELIAQLRGLRAFELARMRQDQIDHEAAIENYSQPAKPPADY